MRKPASKTAVKKSTTKAAATQTDAGQANGRSWLNLRLIEVFVTVVQEDGMTHAANRLGMTQSAVSQAIGTIENGLGAQLIDRSKRPMQLTLFGNTFYERAIELLRRSRELEQLVSLQQNAQLPLLRMGMVDSFASTVGPVLMREIANMASRWSVTSGVSGTDVRGLMEQRIDLIVTSDDIGDAPKLLDLPLLKEPFFIVAPKGVSVPGGGLEELGRALPFIRYSPGAFLGRQIDLYLRHHGLSLQREYEFDTSDAVLAMVRAGLGWAITTPLCVLKTRPLLEEYQYLPLPNEGLQRTLRLVAHQDEHAALWERISATARTILKHQWVPQIRSLTPWDKVMENP
ncbi:LysR family transcriptional regulator [Bordetella sp. BOR01]|uniref:LysR family transcriptional regulator n=1 Tax=Bordetella sp. BOR01 TaxID=2854779 RepID=UPI001C478ADF|nr:LysR family transcriptional regulator [Bordetella sp. BOR01]MBV7486825.1 LysR family transcriptional regulator [Bordetella sp. BOR01]